MKTLINLIGGALVLIGGAMGLQVIANIETAIPTLEPLAFACTGFFILVITNIKGA
jgi:hypothetical protein